MLKPVVLMSTSPIKAYKKLNICLFLSFSSSKFRQGHLPFQGQSKF